MKKITVEKLDDLNIVNNIMRQGFDQDGNLKDGPLYVFIVDCFDAIPEEELPKEKQRSLPQNASLHVYCDDLAKQMNAAGITQRELVGRFKDGFELPVSPHMIKDIFREVGKALYQKESTKYLTTVEMQDVYMIIDQRFAEITGVSAPWPSRESQSRG